MYVTEIKDIITRCSLLCWLFWWMSIDRHGEHCRLSLHAVKLTTSGTGLNSNVEGHEKYLMCPSTFLRCPSRWEGTTKNRVGTANSFLTVLRRWR